LVALEVADLEEVADGLRVMIRHGRTDQEGQEQEIAILRGSAARALLAVHSRLCRPRIRLN
jgi:hypothetical protein